jgi:hypothetical protein
MAVSAEARQPLIDCRFFLITIHEREMRQAEQRVKATGKSRLSSTCRMA